MVEEHDLPLARRRRQRVVEPLVLLRGTRPEERRDAGVEVEEVGGPVGGGVVASGRAEEPQLRLDLLEALVAVVQVGVVVADGELEADPCVEQRLMGRAKTSSNRRAKLP